MERFLKDVGGAFGVGGIGPERERRGAEALPGTFSIYLETGGTEPPVRRSSFMVKAQTGL